MQAVGGHNKKCKKAAKRDFMQQQQEFVEKAYQLDPRVAAHRERVKQERWAGTPLPFMKNPRPCAFMIL